jgi:hypothetical protein
MILLTVCVAVSVSSGVALAATRQCKARVVCYETREQDKLLGTAGPDEVHGRGGDDTISGNPAANHICSQNGISAVSSGGSSDFVNVFDFAPGDTVDCGGVLVADNDTVYFDSGDTVTNCENLNP